MFSRQIQVFQEAYIVDISSEHAPYARWMHCESFVLFVIVVLVLQGAPYVANAWFWSVYICESLSLFWLMDFLIIHPCWLPRVGFYSLDWLFWVISNTHQVNGQFVEHIGETLIDACFVLSSKY